jgi:DNA topoisomerase-1
MEQTLDEISTGEAAWLPYLQKFYLGEQGLETQVKEQETKIDPAQARMVQLENLGVIVRIGKFGAYLETEREGVTVTASIPKDLTPGELDPAQVEILLKQKTEGPDKLGLHPETGEPIYVKIGAYGPYVQLGDATEENKKPKMASLPKGVTIETITLELAVSLLELPRTLGVHPETQGRIQANNGRFGPYVVHDQGKVGKDYRSIKAPDDPTTITLDRALELLAQPKATRGRGAKKTPLRELGLHPADQEPVNLYSGPYGTYVNHGKTNAGLPEGETVEALTLETALQLLAAKAPAKTKKTTGSSKTSAKTAAKTTKPKATKAPKTTKTKTTDSAETKAKTTKATGSTRATKTSAKTSAKTDTTPVETPKATRTTRAKASSTAKEN